ncbi:MAG: hypothetical protein PHT38_02410 [Halothiobacillus sp.]|nr:hypothetical protein [Halothiobacillus sp.]
MKTKLIPGFIQRNGETIREYTAVMALCLSFMLGVAVAAQMTWLIPTTILAIGILISLYIHFERERETQYTNLYVRLKQCQNQAKDRSD